MDRIVERLYHDTLDLQSASYFENPAYQEDYARWNALYKQLEQQMGMEFADTYGDAQGRLDDWCSISWFEKGLRLGVRLMMETLGPL